MSLRVLITGITGFAGSHPAEYLLDYWRERVDRTNHD
jgi:nucleoside-diphosphate-sugar epimerase